MDRIGVVELLQQRIYPLDARASADVNATSVIVEPGEYYLYRDGITHFWMMHGVINVGRVHRLGDGIFTMQAGDVPSGIEVMFPSRMYGPDEWAEFISSGTCLEGHPEQRLRIKIRESTSR